MKISVLLEALTGKFETDTQRASKNFQREMRKLERQAVQFGRRASLAIAAAGTALTVITKRSIDYADSIGKTADKLGIGVEALQEYRFAASQAGIQQNTFDMALQRFTRRAAEAAQGTGEAKAVLKELGIQLTDNEGRLRKAEDLLRDVADAMQTGYSPAEKLRIAFKLFDSEGVAMVNMLRDGAAGLDTMSQKARDAGVVLEEKLVRNAEQAANKMDEFQKVMQVSIARAVTENADSIIALTEALIGFIGAAGRAINGWNRFLAAMGVAETDGADEILARMGQIQTEISNLERANPNVRLGLTGAETIGQRIQDLKDEFGELQVKLKDLSAVPFKPFVLDEKLDLSSIPALLDLPADPKLVQKRADEIANIVKGLSDQVATFGMGDERALITLIDLGAGQEAINQASDLLGQLAALETAEQSREAAIQNRLAMEQEYASLVDSLQTPTETHVAQMERIAELFDAGIIPNVEEYAEALNRASARFDEMNKKTTELDEFGKEAARNMQDALGDFLFDPWDKGLEGMAKGFSETIRRMAAEAAAAAIFKKLFGVEGGEGGILSGLFGGSGEGGFGAFISSLFGGARARGGPVFAGRPYLVGEEGPELVVPRTSGHVVPNDELLGSMGGQVINNTWNLPPVYSPRAATQIAQEANRRQQIAATRNR